MKVTVPTITQLSLAGAGNIEAIGFSGGELSAEISGAGEIRAEGSVDSLTVDVSGTGALEAQDLSATRAMVEISGAGSADVTATDSLDAVVSGVGSVTYGGEPAAVAQEVSGVGSISERE